MKWYYITCCIAIIVLGVAGSFCENLAHEKEMKQLEIKKLELELKLKQK